MIRKIVHRTALIALLASPAAFADEVSWYPASPQISAAEVDAYFDADAASSEVETELRVFAHDRIMFEQGEPQAPDAETDHSAHVHFDGYCPTALASSDVKLGVPRQFIEINEFSSLVATYDDATPHAVVEGGNVFAKADLDWRNIF
ncbi:MAG: hypothetical protein AAFY34_13990 [Pseudomonadota bacterium]